MARRLKTPIRRTLIGIGVCAEVAGAITLANGTLLVKQTEVHAQANPKEVINIISKLKNNDLSKMKTLKSYVLDTYQSVNMIDDLNADESKVLLVTPTVVTEPTISNSSIVIVPVASSKTDSLTVSDEQTTDEKQTNAEETKGDSQGGTTATQQADETCLPAGKASVSDSETNPVSKPETDTDSGFGTTEEKVPETSNEKTQNDDLANEKQVTDKSESKKEDDKTDDGDQQAEVKAEALQSKSDSEETSDKTSEAEDLAKDISVIELTSLGSDEEMPEESLEKMDLRLKSDKVTIEDGSEFVAEDYIEKIEGGNDILPTLKISGKVDSYTDGEYKVTYTLVGTNGTSVSKDLTVVIKGNEEAKKAKEEARQKAIDAFVEKYSGKHIDVDGYYGDQCWDLWGRFICDLGLYSKYDCGTGSYGYAYGVYLRYDKTNAKKYFDKIENVDELKAGDWLFWDKGSSCPDSHVALLLKNNGDGTGVCLTQSYGEGTRVMTLKLDVMGGFRPTGSADWYKLAE